MVKQQLRDGIDEQEVHLGDQRPSAGGQRDRWCQKLHDLKCVIVSFIQSIHLTLFQTFFVVNKVKQSGSSQIVMQFNQTIRLHYITQY